MATVTKLKAAVNNKNLPILGNDGNLYNYYVGRWSNAVSDIGYNPAQAEIDALNAFIETGISDGWIDKVKYFMPIIGDRTAPLAGIVPLIDSIADYELSESSILEGVFSYDANNKITFLGKGEAMQKINIPVTAQSFGMDNVYTVYANINYGIDDEENGIRGLLLRIDNQQGNQLFSIRKGTSSSNALQSGIKFSTDSEASFNLIGSTTVQSQYIPYQWAFYFCLYKDGDVIKRNRYYVNKGADSPRVIDLRVTVQTELPEDLVNYSVSGDTNNSVLKFAVNCLAYIDPTSISASDLRKFNAAVFALTTALGR